uniref:Podocalyxin n=1 Tax=Nannospalax galili TaxID=1026970 RepID=A0A8C6QTK2_NANGA
MTAPTSTAAPASKQDKRPSDGSVITTLPPAQQNTVASKNSVVTSVQPPIDASKWTSDSGDKSSGSTPTTLLSGFQGDKPKTTSRPTTDENRASSGGQSNDSALTAPPATQGRDHLATKTSTDQANISQPPSISTLTNTASPPQSAATTLKTTESSPSGQPTRKDFPSSAGTTCLFSVFALPITASPVTPEETQSTSSEMPGVSLPFFTPPQPTGSSVGTEATPTADEFISPSTNLTPTAPRGPSTPSPIWTFGNYKVKCDPAIMPDPDLLILNLTRASLCDGNPSDEKLVELLCNSVKVSFSPAQDQCFLQVAPILESQAVAVKRVIIETKLPSKAVFELLKDKWDDLREAGVSDMHLGKEGPPEPNEDRFSMPLIITIVCMASFLLLVAALYGCCHQRVSQRKDQQRLTEELQTVENGYHDNPTLEVMETSSEMQEKKVVNLNGELGDSWIVPLDNLTKDDLDEEEDTHL